MRAANHLSDIYLDLRRFLRKKRRDEMESQNVTCPVCGHILIAVQGRRAPYFRCGCVKRCERGEHGP